MTKGKNVKKTKSPAIAGRLPLREVADEQQDSGGDTPQKEKKSSSRLAKASLEEEPEEVVDLEDFEDEEEEDSPHDAPQFEQEISSQHESSIQPAKEDSPIKTNSSVPPPSGVQDLLKRRREKLQARKRCAKRGGAYQDSDSEDSVDLEDDDFHFPVIDETLGDHALPRDVLWVDRPPTARALEMKNEEILHDIVERFKDCFLSHWDKQLFEFMNSKLVTNRFKLGDADDADFYHRYTSGMPEPSHGNQRRGIISMRQFLPKLLDGVHHSRLGALLNAFHLQVRFFVNDCCPKEYLIFKAQNAFYQVAWMVKMQIFCDDDARLVQNEFAYPNSVSPLVKLVIHPKWDHSIELVSRTMCTAAAKEKRERNSGLGQYPDWMVDREAVRANIHAPRPFSSDRDRAEPSRLDMDVAEPPPQVMPTRDFLSPGVNMSVGATGSSSQTTSLLVNAAELPTFSAFTPGSKEFHRLVTYVRHCENHGQDLRIDKWPRLLRSNMNTQYRFNFCMAEGSSHRQDEWQSFSASQLRECLEKMAPGYRSHYTEDPFAEFSRWLGRHTVTIDWSQLSEPRAHSFFRLIE